MSSNKKRGRPSSFKEEYIQLVENYCLLGATDKELADFFGVSEQTLNSWKKNYPLFLESIKKGKQIADSNVASKLYNRAIGYEFDERHYEHQGSKVPENPGALVETKRVKKHVPADTTAAIFWLKNRQPEKWRDRKELDTTVKLEDELENMTDEQLEAIVRGKK